MHSRTLAKITLARKASDITSLLAQAGDFRVENRWRLQNILMWTTAEKKKSKILYSSYNSRGQSIYKCTALSATVYTVHSNNVQVYGCVLSNSVDDNRLHKQLQKNKDMKQKKRKKKQSGCSVYKESPRQDVHSIRFTASLTKNTMPGTDCAVRGRDHPEAAEPRVL